MEWPRSNRPGGRRGRSPRAVHDAVVRLTMSAICGTDLHMVRGTMPGKQPGTVLGHEGVGVVEVVGSQFCGSRGTLPAAGFGAPSPRCGAHNLTGLRPRPGSRSVRSTSTPNGCASSYRPWPRESAHGTLGRSSGRSPVRHRFQGDRGALDPVPHRRRGVQLVVKVAQRGEHPAGLAGRVGGGGAHLGRAVRKVVLPGQRLFLSLGAGRMRWDESRSSGSPPL